MKIFGHPVHVMLIHFPVGLLPMDLVSSFLAYRYNTPAFSTAGFYCLTAGVASGYVAVLTGLLDLINIPREQKATIGTGLLHGFINGVLILVYTIFAYKAWHEYPQLPPPTAALLGIKTILILTLFSGNFLGGTLIYKHHIGIHKQG